MTRRGVIQRALLVAATVLAWLTGCVSRRATSAVAPGLGPPAKGEPLSAAETDTLVTFGEILVEGRTLATTERRILADYIADRTTQSAESLSLYRMAARTLDRLAGQPFAKLGLRERRELIEREGLAGQRANPENDLGGPVAHRTVRTRMVPDLVRGYYRSVAGWAVVGYETFPGRCGDLTRYTRRER